MSAFYSRSAEPSPAALFVSHVAARGPAVPALAIRHPETVRARHPSHPRMLPAHVVPLAIGAHAALFVVACATLGPVPARLDAPPTAPALVLSGEGRAWLAPTQTYSRVCVGDASGLLLPADATLRVTGPGPVVIGGAGVVPIGEGTPTLTIEAEGPVWVVLDLSRGPARIAGDVGSLRIRGVGEARLHLGPLESRGDIVTLTGRDTTIDGAVHGTGTGSFFVQVDPGAFPSMAECIGDS